MSRDDYIKEHGGDDGITFNLVDKATVKRLQKKGDVKLPYKDLDEEKDEKWNTKLLNSKLMENIISGKPITELADSIYDVVGRNEKSAMRNARTMMTGAENAGRQDSYEDLTDQGVVMKKVWIATPDDRTRESHFDLDGEEVDVDEEFSNGCQYPGDPNGEPSEVYNCRCTMRTHIVGFKKADGSVVEVKGDRGSTMHEEQMEAEEQRREEEKRKDADLETRRVVVKDNINNNCFNGDVDEAVKSSIMKTIDSMDEKRLSILEKTSNNLSVNWKDEEGTSHYTYGSGNITMYNEKYGEKRSAEDSTTTFWHEYGHFVDDRASNSGYGYVYTDSRGNSFTIQGIGNEAGEAYYKAAKDDINNFLETTGLSDKYTCIQNDDKGIPWLIDKDGNYIDPRQMSFDQQNDLNNALKDWMNDQSGYTEAVNYLYSMGYPRDPQYSDYMEMYVTPKRQEVKFRERYKGAQEDFYKESQRVGEAQEEFKKTHDYEALLKEQSRLIEEAERIEGKLGWVTDTFDGGASGAFTSVIRGGHTADYYLTNNNGRGEAVANVFSAIMTQDPDIVAGMESLCPNTYKVLSEVILK